MSVTPLDRRLRVLERRLGEQRPPAGEELWRDVPRALTFAEICAGQQALEAHGGDPARALRAGDPVMTILVEVARARAAGRIVPELFAQ